MNRLVKFVALFAASRRRMYHREGSALLFSFFHSGVRASRELRRSPSRFSWAGSMRRVYCAMIASSMA